MEEIPIRNQRAAQLLVGSITEIILILQHWMPKSAIQINNTRKAKGKGKSEKGGKTHKPVEIRSSAIDDTLVILVHFEEGTVLASWFSEL